MSCPVWAQRSQLGAFISAISTRWCLEDLIFWQLPIFKSDWEVLGIDRVAVPNWISSNIFQRSNVIRDFQDRQRASVAWPGSAFCHQVGDLSEKISPHCGRHGCPKCDIALGYTMIHPYSPTRHSNKLKQPCQGIVNIFQVFFPIMLGVPHRETTGCNKCFVQIMGFQSRIGLKKQSAVVFLLKTWTSWATTDHCRLIWPLALYKTLGAPQAVGQAQLWKRAQPAFDLRRNLFEEN